MFGSTIKFFKVYTALLLLVSFTSYAETERFSVGAGVGAMYGNNIGVNFSYRAIDRLDLNASLGRDSRATVGLQYHLTDNTKFFQPRIAIKYGVNGHLEVYDEPIREEQAASHSKTHTEYFYGASVGAGARLGFGHKRKHGVNIDVFYRVDDGGLDDRKTYLREHELYKESQFGDVGPGGFFAAFFGYFPIQLSVGWSYKFD